ncbi:MAG: TonB-dependent receptor [Ferruginibacter sp.]|nr:TonB-dependent receptor [Cytophagales bacterium]
MTVLCRALFPWMGLLLFVSHASGQSLPDERVSGDFAGLPFAQFVRAVETRTGYRFYYDPAQTDSLTVNLRVEKRPLRAVLAQLFAGTDFRFAIDSKRVFITRGQEIRTELPVGFFDREAPAATDDTLVVVAASPGAEKKEKRITPAESKRYEFGVETSNPQPGKANLAGYVRNIESGEPVVGAAVYVENPRIGVTTDQFGYYSLTLPRGRHELVIKSIGLKGTRRQIGLHADGKLDIELLEDVIPLREVVIEAEKDANVSGLQMGLEKLDIKTIKQVPTAFGEADILRVILTLPGVKSVGEGTTGFNVRGGAADQNLILFNDATIYNPSHLFGFFSAFNPDVLKTVELYKSSIPARYGGRLSSVLEITTRDGNKKKFAGSGGVGLLTGRLTLEGPLVKDKTSFLVAGRSTYSDWLLKRLRNASFRNSQASFYDLNAHLSHEFNDKNSLYLTGYVSQDQFKLNSDTAYTYRNQNITLKWKHVFNNQLYGVFTGGYGRYQYAVSSEQNPVNAFELAFAVNQANVKADFSYFPTAKHTLDFGISSIRYQLYPGNFGPRGGQSLIVPDVMPAEQALESAVYISDRFDVHPRLSLYAGLRYSLFHYLGPKQVLRYPADVSREEGNARDTAAYRSGDVIQTYGGPEYRLSARYAFSENTSVKASYNTLRQYLHLLSNTTAISPTDVWKLSDPNIRPQWGEQVSLGVYRNLKSNTIETSVEVYYKTLRNYLDYKSGATLILNPHVETDVISTGGKAYGVEVMVKKLTGKLNGWVSYTYARSLLRMNDPLAGELVNGGRFYPSNFDKPHDFTFIGNYRFSRRFSLSLNLTYSTGRPITLPLAKYDLAGSKRVFYSERNQYRIPDYYRADVSMNIEGNHKVKKLSHSSWTLAIYNLMGRKNAYSVYFNSQQGNVKGYKLSIFGQPIPTVTYNFRF